MTVRVVADEGWRVRALLDGVEVECRMDGHEPLEWRDAVWGHRLRRDDTVRLDAALRDYRAGVTS